MDDRALAGERALLPPRLDILDADQVRERVLLDGAGDLLIDLMQLRLESGRPGRTESDRGTCWRGNTQAAGTHRAHPSQHSSLPSIRHITTDISRPVLTSRRSKSRLHLHGNGL